MGDNHMENDIMTLLNDKTNNFKRFCLNMLGDYDFYYQSLTEINEILKTILPKILEMKENLNKQVLDQKKRADLMKQLRSWQAEAKAYLAECNKIKAELKKIGVTNNNISQFEKSEKYAGLIKKITVYNILKNRKGIDPRELSQHELTINDEFRSLFNTTENLIGKTKNEPVLTKEVVDSEKSFFEDKAPSPEISERITNNPVLETTLEKENSVYSSQEPVLPNQKFYNVFEKVTDIKTTPSLDEGIKENKIKVEELNISDTEKTLIEKRMGTYNHYWEFLFNQMDDYNEKSASLKSTINEKMARNESISKESQEHDEILKLQEIVTREIRRLSTFTQEEKTNIQVNLNIPDLNMSDKEIEEHLVNKIPFYENMRLSKESESITELNNEEIRNQNERRMRNQLEIIKQLKNDNVEKEKIVKILEILTEDKTRQKNKISPLGSIFHWRRKAKKVTSEKINKAMGNILFAAVLTLLAYGATQTNHFANILTKHNSVTYERQSNNVQSDVVIEITNQKSADIKEYVPELINPTTIEEIKIHLGEFFVVQNNAPIYSDEYLENADIPTYSPDTVREVLGVGIRKANGTVELARSEERLEELVNAGGKQISVFAFDGFFNINELQIQKGLNR